MQEMIRPVTVDLGSPCCRTVALAKASKDLQIAAGAPGGRPVAAERAAKQSGSRADP